MKLIAFIGLYLPGGESGRRWLRYGAACSTPLW